MSISSSDLEVYLQGRMKISYFYRTYKAAILLYAFTEFLSWEEVADTGLKSFAKSGITGKSYYFYLRSIISGKMLAVSNRQDLPPCYPERLTLERNKGASIAAFTGENLKGALLHRIL